MDSILWYTLLQMSWFLLLVQLGTVFACCVLIIIIRNVLKWKKKRKERLENELSKIIEELVIQQTLPHDLTLPSHLQNEHRTIIEILEKFDHLVTDPIWKEIKGKIFAIYLLPFIKKNIDSRSWVQRQLVARAYLLCPTKANHDDLLKLIYDPKFLVRVVAAVTIIQTHYRDLFVEVIRQMVKESPLSRFSYRDALIGGSQEHFLWVEELLKTEKDPQILAVCIDLLSTRMTHDLLPLLKPFLEGKDRGCRLLAIKALGNVPSDDAMGMLLECTKDADWEIRAEAIKGLAQMFAVKSIPRLQELLNDPEWWVRLQAAIALKQLGMEGKTILATQNKKKSPLAYEISQYILAMPD